MFAKLFITICLFFLWGCSSSTPQYEIAIDPSWNPINFDQRQKNVTGFSTELLTRISQEEKISISILNTNWDSLLEGLKAEKYQGALSSLYPYNFNEANYCFSETFLETGPVLIVPISSKENSLKDFSGKIIGVLSGSPDVLLLEKDPTIYIQTYDSIPMALNDLVSENIQAAILPSLSASAYVEHLYFKKLKVVSKPLNDQGLRLITLKNKNTDLVQKFNRGLEKMKKDGSYDELISKWNLR